MLKIATGTENHSIFILRDIQDAQLISLWHMVLTELSKDCHVSCKSLVSIHLFRMGIEEASSTPTVLINTSQQLDETRKRNLQLIVTNKLSFASSSVQIVFRKSHLRRSVDHSEHPLPPICRPRNIRHYSSPGTGASIGVALSLQDTSTLGCYLLVDGEPMVLTVDHLLPDSASNNTVITHVSGQDRFEMLASQVRRYIALYPFPPHHDHNLCGICAHLRSPSSEILELMGPHSLLPEGSNLGCPLYRDAMNFLRSISANAVTPLARRYIQSGRRYRTHNQSNKHEVQREMDWALFEILEDGESGQKQRMREQHYRHPHTAPDGDICIRESDVRPGAYVKSLGRTSGHQVGRISNSASIIFHETYETLEWCVLKRPETGVDDWVEGGIGVDGDSGAIIVDEDTDAIYGMLWGRSGDGPTTVTLFTPVKEILHDIAELSGVNVHQVEVLWGQKMPRPPTNSGREDNLVPKSESVPITMADETEQSTNLDEPVPITGVRRLSSIEVGHPRPFERYRRHDRSHPSVPRSMADSKDEDVVLEAQYPGSHTYTRYALEQEIED